jgi:prepilin peptidase CpaA
MPFQFDVIPLAGFAGLMMAAAIEDLRRLVIPNTVVLSLCMLWPLHLAAAPSLTLSEGIGAAACATAVFTAGALLFARGLIGGGDVKLLAASTLWAGPHMAPALLVVTAVLGGLLAVVLLSSSAFRATFPSVAAVGTRPATVPYGVAIAAAALIITIPPNLT